MIVFYQNFEIIKFLRLQIQTEYLLCILSIFIKKFFSIDSRYRNKYEN